MRANHPTIEADALPTRFAFASEESEEAISFSAFVRILRQGKRTILSAGLGVLTIAAVIAFSLPPSYTASASFVPPEANGGLPSTAAISGQLSALGAGSLLGSKNQGDLYVGILKSHLIARTLIQRFHLENVYRVKGESQAEKMLHKNSSFETDAKDPLVTIEVVDKNPQRARDLANAYLQALQAASTSLALTESSERRLFYEQRVDKEKEDLANAEIALKQNEEQTGLIALAGQTAVEIQTIAQLRAQITSRQVSIAALLQDETEENPDVLRLRNEIASLQTQLEQLENGRKEGGFDQFSTAQVPALQLEYVREAREVKYHEALFAMLSKQYEAARLDEAKESPLGVLDRATVPDTKSGPHRSIILAYGFLAGSVGGLVWVLYRFSERRRTSDPRN